MITLDELNRLIGKRCLDHLAGVETAPLSPQAFFDGTLTPGRVLAADVYSALKYPLADQSAMDGYALTAGSKLSKGAVFSVIGEQAAGELKSFDSKPGLAVRIFTGAWLPQGFDTVVMQENVTLGELSDPPKPSSDQQTTHAQITLNQDTQALENVRRKAEEITEGERIFERGHCLSGFDIGLLAQLGLGEVDLFDKPVITILASGDELVEVGKPLSSAQLHNTNSLLIAALLSDLPVTLIDGGIVPDTLEACTQALISAARTSNVVITTGGVSAGDKDYFARALDQVGTLYQHKVAMKPGKPVLFGEIGPAQLEGNPQLESADQNLTKASDQSGSVSALYFGLPGNPVSSGITALKILIPALKTLCGQTLPAQTSNHEPKQLSLSAKLTGPIRHQPGRLEFVRGFLKSTAGELSVEPLAQGSHRVKNMARANCLITVPSKSEGLQAGDQVSVELL